MKNSSLLVRNIAPLVGLSRLEGYFAAFGDIKEIHYPIDEETGESEGFAIVTFFSPQAAKRALEKDGYSFAGNILSVELCK